MMDYRSASRLPVTKLGWWLALAKLAAVVAAEGPMSAARWRSSNMPLEHREFGEELRKAPNHEVL
jgi:hypothetical protein